MTQIQTDTRILHAFESTLHTGAETATGTGTVEFDTEDGNDVVAELDCTASGGTSPTLDVLLEESVDKTKWFTAATYAQLTSTGTELKKVTNTARYLRVTWTITGSAGQTFTFTVKAVSR